MSILHIDSLANTLDDLNDRILREEPIHADEKMKVALWLSSLQGKPRSYRGMFAISTNDRKNETKLFTGEILDSNAALGHILGEETLHALLWLNIQEKNILTAISNAIDSFAGYTDFRGKNPPPMYCCGKCTDAVLRVMNLIPELEAKHYIQSSLKTLKSLRNGEGKWKRFPFYYTLYTLMDLPGAEEELNYALPVLKRSLKTLKPTDIHKQRKLIIGEKILARLS
jgi:hypothetical protein